MLFEVLLGERDSQGQSVNPRGILLIPSWIDPFLGGWGDGNPFSVPDFGSPSHCSPEEKWQDMAVIAVVPPAQLASWSQALCDFELKKI